MIVSKGKRERKQGHDLGRVASGNARFVWLADVDFGGSSGSA